jgi:predicted AlkP superfamily phosphohydrolase/phosphomutase
MIDKILLIGWYGASWNYIEPLLEEGNLPNIKSLLDIGTRSVLRSTIPPYTNIAWPSLVTGRRPDKTGVFDGTKSIINSYQSIPTNLVGFRGIPIWKWLNNYGLRSGVLNVPMTYCCVNH